jgi:hypothetical protein
MAKGILKKEKKEFDRFNKNARCSGKYDGKCRLLSKSSRCCYQDQIFGGVRCKIVGGTCKFCEGCPLFGNKGCIMECVM